MIAGMVSTEAYIVGAILILLVLIMLYPMLMLRVVEKPELGFYQLERDYMADLLTYVVTAAPAVDHDVVTRELVVQVGDATGTVSTWPGSSVELGNVVVPQDTHVVLTLVDVDDAGNRSAPAVVEFVAADTIPPAAPGSFGVTLVGETPVPDVAPPVVDDVPPSDA